MNYSDYVWQISFMAVGYAGFLEHAIKSSRLSGFDNFMQSALSVLWLHVAIWNTICLLSKLNIIHPL